MRDALPSRLIAAMIAEYANARGWDPEHPAVVGAVAAAVRDYDAGGTVGDVCESARRTLRDAVA